jgi:IS30 family transposase
MWERWRRGETLHHIAQLFDRGHSSIHRILSETGGFRPPPRLRSRVALSLREREEISRGVVACRSMREIAASLGRAPSTLSREIRRNGGCAGYAEWFRAAAEAIPSIGSGGPLRAVTETRDQSLRIR